MKQTKQKSEPPLVMGGQGRSSESLTNDGIAVFFTLVGFGLLVVSAGVVSWIG